VYYIHSAATDEAKNVLKEVQTLAKELGIEIVVGEAADLEGALEVLENTPEDCDWLFLTPHGLYGPEFTEKALEVSASRQIGVTWFVDSPVRGYLISYGLSMTDTAKQAAHIVDRILRGASPADLPVQTAENYLTVNLEAAEAIGWDIPMSVLRQANTIVRPGDFDEPEENTDG
jgi:putative ABC transport system substrate-binding protein